MRVHTRVSTGGRAPSLTARPGAGNHSGLVSAGLGEEPSPVLEATGPPLPRAFLQMGDKSSLPISARVFLPQRQQWHFPHR